MSGMIAVKEYQTGADMLAGYAAARARTRDIKPIRKPVVLRIDAPALVLASPLVPFRNQDAHVFARYKEMANNPAYLQKVIDTAVAAAVRAVKEAAGDEDEGPQRVLAEPIIREMCKFYGVSGTDIKSDRRTNAITFPRQKMMWVIKNRTKFSYPEIGRKFGDRDHTTIMHAVRKINKLIAANDPSVSEMMRWLDE